jgi:excisionase family DNA binding protein
MKQRAPSGPLALEGPRRNEPAAMRSTAISTQLGDGGANRLNGALLTELEVAERLRVSLACLRRWRLERRGPRFLKVGSLVRYPAEELDRWINFACGWNASGNSRRAATGTITPRSEVGNGVYWDRVGRSRQSVARTQHIAA